MPILQWQAPDQGDGWFVGEKTGSWLLAVCAGFLASAVLGLLMQFSFVKKKTSDFTFSK